MFLSCSVFICLLNVFASINFYNPIPRKQNNSRLLCFAITHTITKLHSYINAQHDHNIISWNSMVWLTDRRTDEPTDCPRDQRLDTPDTKTYECRFYRYPCSDVIMDIEFYFHTKCVHMIDIPWKIFLMSLIKLGNSLFLYLFEKKTIVLIFVAICSSVWSTQTHQTLKL